MCLPLPPPAMGAQVSFLGYPAMRTRWMYGNTPHKAGDVETNPGPTTSRKQVWICNICHRHIQVRKQISIRCNMIEHWMHLRCSGIRLAQYTDTWTCHQHKECKLTPNTDLIPPHSPRPWPKPPTHSHPPQHHHNQNTDPTFPLFLPDW